MNFNSLDYDDVNTIHRGDTEECGKIIPPHLYNFLFFQEIKIASLFFTCLVFHVYINSSKSKIELKSSKYYFPSWSNTLGDLSAPFVFPPPLPSVSVFLQVSWRAEHLGLLQPPWVGLLFPAVHILLFFLICSFFVEASFVLTS